MKWWTLAKQFPKYALVAGIIFGSTALFVGWWLFFHSRPKAHTSPQDTAAQQAAIRARAAKAEARIDYLFLADDDLYDAGTGELLFKNWLKGAHPVRLFFDPKSKKILAQHPQGFARYAFDGTREAAMMNKNPPAFLDGFKKIVFAKDKEVWQADVDWEAFKFVNERKVTSIEQFYENHFAENIALGTAKTIIVRNLNTLLRVNLDTGSVKPTRLPLDNIGSRRSPDSKWVVGMEGGQFYCYDVDADEAKTIPVSRNSGMSDFQWLGNDKCLGLAGGKAVVLYDRLSHSLTEVAALPFPCFKVGEPSPDGRFIFCAGGIDGRNGVLVDLEKKKADRALAGAGICWISNNTYAFSREVPDSDLRGTWFQAMDQPERRVSPEPYLVSNTGPQLLVMPSTRLLILVTIHGLSRINSTDTELTGLVQSSHQATHVLTIQEWKKE